MLLVAMLIRTDAELRFTHKNDIPSVIVEATITFMNPLTFSSFIQSCNTCGILKHRKILSKKL